LTSREAFEQLRVSNCVASSNESPVGGGGKVLGSLAERGGFEPPVESYNPTTV
jgi:hypothetical protein